MHLRIAKPRRRENVPGACATHNFSYLYLIRGPCLVLTLLRWCWCQAIRTDPQNLSTSKDQCDNTSGCCYSAVKCNIPYTTELTQALPKSDTVAANNTLYLALLSVCCQDFQEHWLCYKGTALLIGNCVAVLTTVIVNETSRFWNPVDCYNIKYSCETQF